MLPVTVLIDSLLYGNLITLMAIGLTLTYLTLKIPNFAHGDLAMVGVYSAYTVAVFLNINPYTLLPIAFLMGGLSALGTYILVYRPLFRKGASIVVMMVASIAVDIVIRSILQIYADIMSSTFNVYSRGFLFKDFSLNIYEVRLPGVLVISSLTVLAIIVSLYLFLSKTRFGIAMRAAIENPWLASSLGINVELVYGISWFIAGGITGLAGVFLPFRIPTNPDLGWLMLLSVFAASILGGLESLFGAIAGGYVVGFSEILGIYVLSSPPFGISTAYRPAIPFTILIITLLLAPRGITSVEWNKIATRLRRNV